MADAGNTWTDFAVGAGDVQGTTGGHTIVTKNNVTLTIDNNRTFNMDIE